MKCEKRRTPKNVPMHSILYLRKYLTDLRAIYAKSIVKHLIQTSPGHAVYGGVTESTVDLFLLRSEYPVPGVGMDGGTWRYMFRPHSNSSTPGPGYGQSNGNGPPFPTVNSEVLGRGGGGE